MNFEIATANVEQLRAAFDQLEMRLSRQSHEALESFKDKQKEGDIVGALQITFIHDEPDLKRDVPAIPG
jgi:hypothetical protein